MVKKWLDGNDVAEEEELPTNLLKYDKMMKDKPNFDKSSDKSESSTKIYEKREYIILKVKRGYIVYNKNKEFEKGHTHLKSYSMAKIIINNCIYKKMPKTDNIYLIQSHIRVSTDKDYRKLLEELLEAKKSKDKLKYVNRGKW